MQKKNYQKLRKIGLYCAEWAIQYLIVIRSTKLSVTPKKKIDFQPNSADFYHLSINIFISMTQTSRHSIRIQTLTVQFVIDDVFYERILSHFCSKGYLHDKTSHQENSPL